MINLEYFIVCEDIIIDSETNAVSLVRVLEDYLPDSAQSIIPKLVAVASWRVDDSESVENHRAALIITPPGYQPVPFETEISRGRSRFRTVFTVAHVPASKPGDLKIELQLDGEHNASHTVTIHPIGTGGIARGADEQFGGSS